MMKRLLRHIQDVAQGKTSFKVMRSYQWHKVEKQHLAQYPFCIVCGDTQSVQVHHIFPFHYCTALGRPDLELDPRNLVSLCESSQKGKEQNHHLLLGHYDDFKSSNLNILQDSLIYAHQTAEEIQSNPNWLLARKTKLKALHEMTDQDKQEFIDLMNRTFPIQENP